MRKKIKIKYRYTGEGVRWLAQDQKQALLTIKKEGVGTEGKTTRKRRDITPKNTMEDTS